MGSVGNQNPWAPYDTYKDCSQGICSVYCPQWCYIIFPPPPPFMIDEDHEGDSGPDFSPLIIAVIGILASAFILVSYYTIISKYCRRPSNAENGFSYDENRDQVESSWQESGSGGGLEESIIKSITVCKYKKGDGFVDSTDCSVCLLEFQENDSLRLLPKCSHAFHVSCIDTWLKSQASCPLCRSHIAPASGTIFPPPPAPPQQPPPPPPRIQEPQPASSHDNTVFSAMECRHRINDGLVVIQDLNRSVTVHEGAIVNDDDQIQIPKPRVEDNVIDIREEEEDDDGIQPIRRSVSLNYSVCAGRYQMSIADILRISEDDNYDDYNYQMRDLEKNRNGILDLVRSPLAMRRSISTGRFMFQRYEKGKTAILPN